MLVEDANTYQMTLQTTEVPNSGRAFQNHITTFPTIATYVKQTSKQHCHQLHCTTSTFLKLWFATAITTTLLQFCRRPLLPNCNHNCSCIGMQFLQSQCNYIYESKPWQYIVRKRYTHHRVFPCASWSNHYLHHLLLQISYTCLSFVSPIKPPTTQKQWSKT